MRVLLVAPNASARMGGEAILPLHWLRELRALGVDARLLTHARCRDELQASDYAHMPISYVEDTSAEIALWKFSAKTGGIVSRLSGFLLSLVSMVSLGREVRRMTQAEDFDLIHQVTPVSPRLPSPVTHPKVPVLIGPLNGNMTYPDGFAATYGDGSEEAEGRARQFSEIVHRIFPGKPRAARIYSSNGRTTEGLPQAVKRERVTEFVENGVDLDLWSDGKPMPPGPPKFIYVGRLVGWKAVDILLEAFAALDGDATLTICGDGEARASLEQLTRELGLESRVRFIGSVPQPEVIRLIEESHALVLSSVYECGGAVVLEAMAMARAVIAPNWGGPKDYVTEETGILVSPTSRDAFRTGYTEAMASLGKDIERMKSMGVAGRARIEEHFAWKKKGAWMLDQYKEILGRN